MSQTLLPASPSVHGFDWPTLGLRSGVRAAWRWLMDEKQIATESLFAEDSCDTEWQNTHYVNGECDIPVERYGAT